MRLAKEIEFGVEFGCPSDSNSLLRGADDHPGIAGLDARTT